MPMSNQVGRGDFCLNKDLIMDKYSKIVFFLAISVIFLSKASAQESLTWQDCLKAAAKNHPDLIAAQETIKQSEAAKKITASALFPQVNASAGVTRTKTNGGDTKAVNNYSLGVNGSQLFFDGMKIIDNVNAAKENIKASQQNYRFTSSEVRLRLRTAFVNLLKAQEAIQVTEDIAKLRRDSYELITLRYQSGLEHKGALMTAEANLAQAAFQVAQAKRDIELAQRQLNKEIGAKSFSPLTVKGDFKVVDTAKDKPDFETLSLTNPSLLQLAAQRNAAQFGLKSAYANFFPTLSATGAADRADTRWLPQNDQWDLGLTLSVPLFEGGLRTAQVSQAEALVNQLNANQRSTRDGIIVNLSQTWTSLQDAVETVEVQSKQLAATLEREKIAEAEYSTGFITYDDWTIIEDNLVGAKTNYLNAQANALLAEANWIQAKGETLEYAQ